MTSVASILRSKPDNTVYSVRPSTSMVDAAQVMSARRVGALIVVDGGDVVGIVSERDYVRHVARNGVISDTVVCDVMSAPVTCVRPEQTIEECMALMTDLRVRHLPVRNCRDSIVGMVSIGDLVKDIISEQQFTIRQLEHYITGRSGPPR